MADLQPAAPPVVVMRDDHASPGQRLGAVLLDALIIGLPIGFAVGYWLATSDVLQSAFDASDRVAMPRWLILLGIAAALYNIVGVAVWGQTLGKHIMKIRVTNDQDLGRPGWFRSIARWGVFFVVGWIPFVGTLLCLLIPLPLLWTHQRKGLHDMLAGTLVMKNHAVPWAA